MLEESTTGKPTEQQVGNAARLQVMVFFQVPPEVYLHPAQGDLYFGKKPLQSSTRRTPL